MDTAVILFLIILGLQVARVRYQRTRIALLGGHLARLQLERHMETLTEGYTRAIHEEAEARQRQVLDMFTQTELAAASQVESLAKSMQDESQKATSMSTLALCVPYAEHFMSAPMRDFRELLHIHAKGLRYVVDNEEGWDPKSRAYHLSAELYLFQHSCHWFCKSRIVADARLQKRHQATHQKVLDSVSTVTRSAYLHWLQGANKWSRDNTN